MAAGVVVDVVAAGVMVDVVAAGVVVDVVAAGVVGVEELDFLVDLLDFVLRSWTSWLTCWTSC